MEKGSFFLTIIEFRQKSEISGIGMLKVLETQMYVGTKNTSGDLPETSVLAYRDVARGGKWGTASPLHCCGGRRKKGGGRQKGRRGAKKGEGNEKKNG